MAILTPIPFRMMDLPEVQALCDELNARRAAMKHADDLGIDVDAVTKLICPPPCTVPHGREECPDCNGRSQHTLHDRLDDVLGILSQGAVLDVVEDAIERLTAIVDDLAKPGVTP